jgi:hypothetical protein
MAAFNSLFALVQCPGCGEVAQREVQFRYGDVWQHSYWLGSRLEWGGNQVGDPGWDAAAVPGWLSSCEKCGNEGDLNVVVIDSRIVGISRRIGDEGRDGPDAFGQRPTAVGG